jgi:hypothetical protein
MPDDMTPREERVRERARALWLAAGTPIGRDERFWAEAEAQIDLEDAAAPPDKDEGET